MKNHLWATVVLDETYHVKEFNEKAREFLPDGTVLKRPIYELWSWLRLDWLTHQDSRIIKISPQKKLLLDIYPAEQEKLVYLFLRQVDEYRNTDHLWCEVQDSLIGMQQFIDTCYDGVVITTGQGLVILVNKAFSRISGISELQMVGKSIHELTESGQIPHSCTMQVLKEKRSVNTVVRYNHGNEVLVSSTPLFDKYGQIVRVISNVRDVTELRQLQEQLQSVQALARHYEKELKTKTAAEKPSAIGSSLSPVMKNLYNLLEKVADTDLPLLLTGESGVGKTALAKYVHQLSERSQTGTFVHMNCSAIPENLLESELFGYEAGAFTGAKQTKIGLFELAHKGTILLDEIGDMPLVLQAKILNILQEQRFYRIGGIKPIAVDTRIIAATNKELTTLIANGQFRQDLYFRLNVVPLSIPPLRHRREDIPAMIQSTLQTANKRYNQNKRISPQALQYLIQHQWPGNIRELIHCLERLVVLTSEELIEPHHLPSPFFPADAAPLPANHKNHPNLWRPGLDLKQLISRLESRIINEAVKSCGTLKEAAKQLGIDESTLIRKRNRYQKRVSTMQ